MNSITLLFLLEKAYSGAIVCSFVFIIGLYSYINNKTIKPQFAIIIIFIILFIIISINYYFNGEIKLIEYIPLFAFSLIRYAELSCDEKWYRINSIFALFIYAIYAFYYNSLPIIITELILVFFNIFYLFKNNLLYNKILKI